MEPPVFRESAPSPPVTLADDAAALFETEPPPGSNRPRTIAAVLTTRNALLEAQLLAPAVRACRARGDALETFVLPTSDDAEFDDNGVRRALGVERVQPIPPPQPPAARGPVQQQMRHAYRFHAFLKSRPPDVVLGTQTLGAAGFAMRARELGIGFQHTRFAIVLAPFEQQRRLNERLVTAEPFALIRFQLERTVAACADVAIAPSHRFVENAVQTGAAAETSRFVVLSPLDVVTSAQPVQGRPGGFVIPDATPLARNVAFFATVAKRRPDALRDANGKIRLRVDAPDPSGSLRTLCRERFAGTAVDWTVGRRDPDAGSARRETATGEPTLFVPYCEDFFALGGGLAPALGGAPLLLGAGTAPAEPFEKAGIAVPAFPDVFSAALSEAAAGRRSLRIAARPVDQTLPWTRCLANLAPPKPAPAPDPPPRVSVCILHFNRPSLVPQAVTSALDQTYRNLDVLILDDGSNASGATEALEALVAAHDGRLRLVRQENRYLGAARNGAARAATGEYVFFLDDDNILKPDAIATLVQAARTSGADFVGSFSDIFRGERPTDPGAAGRRILQAGDDTGFSLFQNAILDGNALCRRDAFLALGGNTEDYGIGKDDQEFFARAIQSGRRVAIVPEALFWARHGMTTGLKSLHFDPHAGHFRVLEAYWPALPPHQRGLLLLLQGLCIERDAWLASRPRQRPAADRRPVMALARRRETSGGAQLEIAVRLNSEWLDRARQRRDAEAAVELRRNGRPVARVRLQDVIRGALHLPVRPSLHLLGDTIYSLHDTANAEPLALLVVPPIWRTRRIDGAIESRPRPEMRGWVFDPDRPERQRRVAIHLDGRLHAVVAADELRSDIARWKGTAGRHGFRWAIPDPWNAADSVCAEVFDAETGRALRASPVWIEGGRVIAGTHPGKTGRDAAHVS